MTFVIQFNVKENLNVNYSHKSVLPLTREIMLDYGLLIVVSKRIKGTNRDKASIRLLVCGRHSKLSFDV